MLRPAFAVALLLLACAPLASGALPQATLLPTPLSVARELHELQARHPDLVRVERIGTSVLGQDVWGVRVHAAPDALPLDARPRVVVLAGLHGDEPMASEAAMRILRALVDAYAREEEATGLLEARDVYVVPLANPDGNLLGVRGNARGVDLDRDFPTAAGGAGALMLATSGAAPQPETQALVETLRRLDPDVVLDLHAGARRVLHPWSEGPHAPPDAPVYARICETVRQTPEGSHVPCGSAATLASPAPGTAIDFAYAGLGAIALAIEVDASRGERLALGDVDARLAFATGVVTQALRDAPRYGALPVVAAIEVEPSGATHEVRVTLANHGWLALGPHALRVGTMSGETLFETRLAPLAPGETVEVAAVFSSKVQEVRLSSIYEKTALGARAKEAQLDFALWNMTPVRSHGLAYATAEDVARASLPVRDVPLPPVAPSVGTVVALALLRKRRLERGEDTGHVPAFRRS